ncbi:MAG: Dipeptide transport system permease protein DppB [uncultured Thermomicrobiales bacterium]|uniref:Dipeptide transport system permease protein DppB n=1 Tax=uncultured Thermomicrobiales bacterium TaxID=1645740 RepID=A0A6J4V647_9BACT|nr:MAG: Dipeptide transport system permease protein DppB [uncultured Thermomicrobiales bacterium]
MSRGQFVARRLIQMVPVLIGITVIVFALIQAIPGDPATTMLGLQARPEAVAALNRELGLDRPLWEQYARYLGDVATLDLGESLKFKVAVASLLQTRLAVSLFLIAYATALTILIALPLGIAAALRKDGPFDQIVRALLMVTMVMPGFWVGILLLIVFSIRLGLFPVSGYGQGFGGHLYHLFLPALTIALSLSPILVRSLRGSILEAMGSDYVKTARAKGLRERAVVLAHVLRNALIPAVTLLGLSVGYLMGGTVIIENVFSLPGAGKLLVESIGARDYPVVQSTTLVFAALVILVNLATDLVYSFLDPRVRLG